MTIGVLQTSQIWALLERHAVDVTSRLRLQELCRDTDRVAALVTVHAASYEGRPKSLLLCDLSRIRWTLETLQLLLTLAASRNVRGFLQQLAWGQNNPLDPVVPRVDNDDDTDDHKYPHHNRDNSKNPLASNSTDHHHHHPKPSTTTKPRPTVTIDTRRPRARSTQRDATTTTTTTAPRGVSWHMAYRVPRRLVGRTSTSSSSSHNHKAHHPVRPGLYTADGRDALRPVHATWDRVAALATAVRSGQRRGVTGSLLNHVVVVGRGVPVTALQWLHHAWDLAEPLSAATAAAEDPTMATRLRRLAGVAPLTPSFTTTSSSSSRRTHRRRLSLDILATTDPVTVARTLQALDPAATLVISWALQGNEETGVTTQLCKAWLLQALASHGGGHGRIRRSEVVLAQHMMLVTGNAHVASVINKPDAVWVVPHATTSGNQEEEDGDGGCCEAFTTCTAVTLLPLALVYGWTRVEEFLAGAHDMDRHVMEATPRHNLPLLLALADVWNDGFLAGGSTASRVIIPYTQAWGLYPAFCAALEAQVCGNTATTSTGRPNVTPHNDTAQPSRASLVVDGGLQARYDRTLYQSARILPVELVTSLDIQVQHYTEASSSSSTNTNNPTTSSLSSTSSSAAFAQSPELQETMQAAQDALMASFFAHADELAFGYDRLYADPVLPSPWSVASVTSSSSTSGGGGGGGGAPEPHVSRGNRPSALLICGGPLDAFACGQLVALAEHRAALKAHLWGLDPFVCGMDDGVSLRRQRTEHVKDDLETLLATPPGGEDSDDNNDDDDDDSGVAPTHNMNLSTRTILKHYARMMRQQRGHDIPLNSTASI